MQNSAAFGRGSIATCRVSFAGQEDEDEEVNTQVNEDKFKGLFTRLMREYVQSKGNERSIGIQWSQRPDRIQQCHQVLQVWRTGAHVPRMSQRREEGRCLQKLATCVQTVLVSEARSHLAEAESRRGI